MEKIIQIDKYVARHMTQRIEEMQTIDKKLNKTYSLEEYILFALEEVQDNDGVVIEVVNTQE